MSLSSLIVQREVASIRQVEEALARQVLYGGDLVTNLLEVVQIPEAILLPLLAESVGMTAAPIGMLPAPTPEARALVPEDVAAQRLLVPLEVDGPRLILAVAEPLGWDVVDELSFALGVQIDERIAPLVRIREALARIYGLPLERRMARLTSRLAGVDPTEPNSLPPVAAPKASVPPLPGALVHDLPRLNPPGMPTMGSMHLPEASVPEEPRKSNPPPARASVAPVAGAILPRLLREAKAPSDAPRRRGPITLERFTDELAEVRDREALLHLFFGFSRQFFEYSALFIVHGDIAEGRDAFGSGSSRDKVLTVGVPLDMPSVLKTARERGAPITVVPEDGGLDAVLMTDLKRAVTNEVLVVPIVVRSRVVALFVADDGAAGIERGAQGDVITVAALVGREFERLIVRIKLQGFSGEAPVSERRVDARRVEPKRKKGDRATREAAAVALEQAVAGPVGGETSPIPAAAQSAPPAPPVSVAPAAAVLPTSALPGISEPTQRPAPENAPPPPIPPAPAPLSDTFAGGVSLIPRSPGTLRNFPAVAPPASASAPPPPAIDARPPSAPPPSSVDDARETERLPLPPAPPVEEDPQTSRDYPEPRDEPDRDAPPPSSGRSEVSDLPPPPQVLAVRSPPVRPIPREDPDEHGPVSSTRFAEAFTSRPPPSELRQARLIRDIDALAAKFAGAPRSPSQPPPRVSTAVNLPPHLPPPASSRTPPVLPSVIVDTAAQAEKLAERYVQNPRDDEAEAALLRMGQEAMPAIMKHFPGPLTIARDTLDDAWPRVTECGPVLRLVAGQRRVALPFVLARTEAAEIETRFWATYLLTELAYNEAVPAVVARLFDDSKRVRRAARLAAHILGTVAGPALVAELDRMVTDPKTTSARRVVTLDALGEMRDPLVVPVLLGALGDQDEDVGLAARRALMLVSRQDFGRDVRKWGQWWKLAAPHHRIEWLIDALTHDVPAIRRAAGQELKSLTEQYYGYYDDLPKKDRERAQQKYRDWWESEGRTRFQKG
jgi:Type II secretion system (T2SS), protein E, N-terminal domain